ncbi:hypothetical protein [Celerinatantimonas sp. YJH-8]|uniref:hypothetical protein n=1 Tax=Celerinatantimonas sp. YJH-8 TaxID=3228714 RepID=UPI0038C9D89D
MAAEPLGAWTQALAIHTPWFSSLTDAHSSIHAYQLFWQNLPFWVIALLGGAVVAYQRRWWSSLAALLSITVSWSLGSWPLVSMTLGCWLPIWLSSWLIIRFISRFASQSEKLCRYSHYFPQSWPIIIISIWAMITPPIWWSAAIACWIAIIPQLLSKRLKIFNAMPTTAMKQASQLGANRHQCIEWVAKRYLKQPLRHWLRESLVLSMFSCMLAGIIGFPGIGQIFISALYQQQYEQLAPAVIALICILIFLSSLVASAQHRESPL